MILAARALQLFAGLGLILGIYPPYLCFCSAAVSDTRTLMGHAYWQFAGTPLYPMQLINFYKNVSIAGSLIFIMAIRDQPALLPRP
jgi:putative oxidoreductase